MRDKYADQSKPDASAAAGASDDEPTWHAVICRDGEQPYVESGSEQHIIDQLTFATGHVEETYVFVFKGVRAPVTEGPYAYLVRPDGTRQPLFSITDPDSANDAEISETGLLISSDRAGVDEAAETWKYKQA